MLSYLLHIFLRSSHRFIELKLERVYKDRHEAGGAKPDVPHYREQQNELIYEPQNLALDFMSKRSLKETRGVSLHLLKNNAVASCIRASH